MADTENLPALPEGWRWTTVGEIINPSNEKADPLKIKETRYIGLEHIEKNTGKLLGYGNSKDVKSTKNIFFKGNVLYGKLRPYLNKVYFADFDGVCSTDILVFPNNDNLNNRFISLRLLSNDFVKFANQNVSGVQHPRVNFKALSQFQITLPPLLEQDRIVQKIEELFTDLDAGIRELEKAKVQIKNYRQVVLKAAFDGELTEEWGEKNTIIDPESSLIYKTKKQRSFPENLSYFKLPETWFWTTLQELGTVSGGVTKNSKRNSFPKEFPYLRVANVYSNRLELEEIKCIGVREEEVERYLLKKGDLLVVEGNGSIDQIGRVALWDGSIPNCIHQNHIIKVRFNEPEIGKYVLFWLLSTEGRKNITQVASSTSGLYTLSISKVSSLPVPLAPISEQKVIVSEIERRFSVVDQIEKTIDQSLIQAEKLRQSILKKAFEGKLVPQNPYDEPASVLIERLKYEKIRLEDAGESKRELTNKLKTRNMEVMKNSETSIQYTELYKILDLSDEPLTPKELWRLSVFDDIEDFYAQLKIEIESGKILEQRPTDFEVFLEVKK